MEVSPTTATCFLIVVFLVLLWAWKMLNCIWLRPKRLERVLRAQGLQGYPYKVLVGDSNDTLKMIKDATKTLQPMSLSNDKDIAPRVFSIEHHIVRKFGKNAFFWEGLTPKVIVTNPEQIKQVFKEMGVFKKEKPKLSRVAKLLGSGLPNYEGEQWQRHRKIINPAFHLEKLKLMSSAFLQCCEDMVNQWEGMLSSDGKCEIDVWPFLQNLTSDVISRTAFGSNFEEGKRIFELTRKQGGLIMKLPNVNIPGWWLLPTSAKRRMIEIDREIQVALAFIIDKREKAMKAGEVINKDLLGTLLESNHNEIREHGNDKTVGMTSQEVIEECNTFYLAGQETTSALLVWTMIMLGRYPDWQARAREEVLQVFGNQKPDNDGLSRLKIVTMILYEVLRLYPPAHFFSRAIHHDVKLGNLLLPAGVRISLPILLIHHDHELWGDDAREFKPERFSEGVAKATKGQVSFFPFGWGPRICIGQNFTMMEAKMALSLILQHFSFELSPAYTHAPTIMLSLSPRYGAHIILHKL